VFQDRGSTRIKFQFASCDQIKADHQPPSSTTSMQPRVLHYHCWHNQDSPDSSVQRQERPAPATDGTPQTLRLPSVTQDVAVGTAVRDEQQQCSTRAQMRYASWRVGCVQKQRSLVCRAFEWLPVRRIAGSHFCCLPPVRY
jgi:hypothetical protein